MWQMYIFVSSFHFSCSEVLTTTKTEYWVLWYEILWVEMTLMLSRHVSVRSFLSVHFNKPKQRGECIYESTFDIWYCRREWRLSKGKKLHVFQLSYLISAFSDNLYLWQMLLAKKSKIGKYKIIYLILRG